MQWRCKLLWNCYNTIQWQSLKYVLDFQLYSNLLRQHTPLILPSCINEEKRRIFIDLHSNGQLFRQLSATFHIFFNVLPAYFLASCCFFPIYGYSFTLTVLENCTEFYHFRGSFFFVHLVMWPRTTTNNQQTNTDPEMLEILCTRLLFRSAWLRSYVQIINVATTIDSIRFGASSTFIFGDSRTKCVLRSAIVSMWFVMFGRHCTANNIRNHSIHQEKKTALL